MRALVADQEGQPLIEQTAVLLDSFPVDVLGETIALASDVEHLSYVEQPRERHMERCSGFALYYLFCL